MNVFFKIEIFHISNKFIAGLVFIFGILAIIYGASWSLIDGHRNNSTSKQIFCLGCL